MRWCLAQSCRKEWVKYDSETHCTNCGEETVGALTCLCGREFVPTSCPKFCGGCGQPMTEQFIGSRLSVTLGQQLKQVQQQL